MAEYTFDLLSLLIWVRFRPADEICGFLFYCCELKCVLSQRNGLNRVPHVAFVGQPSCFKLLELPRLLLIWAFDLALLWNGTTPQIYYPPGPGVASGNPMGLHGREFRSSLPSSHMPPGATPGHAPSYAPSNAPFVIFLNETAPLYALAAATNL